MPNRVSAHGFMDHALVHARAHARIGPAELVLEPPSSNPVPACAYLLCNQRACDRAPRARQACMHMLPPFLRSFAQHLSAPASPRPCPRPPLSLSFLCPNCGAPPPPAPALLPCPAPPFLPSRAAPAPSDARSTHRASPVPSRRGAGLPPGRQPRAARGLIRMPCLDQGAARPRTPARGLSCRGRPARAARASAARRAIA